MHAHTHTFTQKPLASQAPRETRNAARRQSRWSGVQTQTPGLSFWVWSPGDLRAILSPKQGHPEGREGAAAAGPHGLHCSRTWSSGPPWARGSQGRPWGHTRGHQGTGRGTRAGLSPSPAGALEGMFSPSLPTFRPSGLPKAGGPSLLQPARPPPTRATSCRWMPLKQVLGVHPSPKARC